MNKEIQKGDRIFARLTMAGKPILEFMINTVANMDELLMELRRMTGTLRGLGRLQVRNQSRGWMSVSNLMFYGNSDMGNIETAAGGMISNRPLPTISSQVNTPKRSVAFSKNRAHMPFPWETH